MEKRRRVGVAKWMDGCGWGGRKCDKGICSVRDRQTDSEGDNITVTRGRGRIDMKDDRH